MNDTKKILIAAISVLLVVAIVAGVSIGVLAGTVGDLKDSMAEMQQINNDQESLIASMQAEIEDAKKNNETLVSMAAFEEKLAEALGTQTQTMQALINTAVKNQIDDLGAEGLTEAQVNEIIDAAVANCVTEAEIDAIIAKTNSGLSKDEVKKLINNATAGYLTYAQIVNLIEDEAYSLRKFLEDKIGKLDEDLSNQSAAISIKASEATNGVYTITDATLVNLVYGATINLKGDWTDVELVIDLKEEQAFDISYGGVIGKVTVNAPDSEITLDGATITTLNVKAVASNTLKLTSVSVSQVNLEKGHVEIASGSSVTNATISPAGATKLTVSAASDHSAVENLTVHTSTSADAPQVIVNAGAKIETLHANNNNSDIELGGTGTIDAMNVASAENSIIIPDNTMEEESANALTIKRSAGAGASIAVVTASRKEAIKNDASEVTTETKLREMAAKDDAIIVITKDIVVTEAIEITGDNVYVRMENGASLSGETGPVLIIQGQKYIHLGSVNCTAGVAILVDGGSATIGKGSIVGDESSIRAINGGSLIITEGDFWAGMTEENYNPILTADDESSITVYGGSFIGWNPHANGFAAEGYDFVVQNNAYEIIMSTFIVTDEKSFREAAETIMSTDIAIKLGADIHLSEPVVFNRELDGDAQLMIWLEGYAITADSDALVFDGTGHEKTLYVHIYGASRVPVTAAMKEAGSAITVIGNAVVTHRSGWTIYNGVVAGEPLLKVQDGGRLSIWSGWYNNEHNPTVSLWEVDEKSYMDIPVNNGGTRAVFLGSEKGMEVVFDYFKADSHYDGRVDLSSIIALDVTERKEDGITYQRLDATSEAVIYKNRYIGGDPNGINWMPRVSASVYDDVTRTIYLKDTLVIDYEWENQYEKQFLIDLTNGCKLVTLDGVEDAIKVVNGSVHIYGGGSIEASGDAITLAPDAEKGQKAVVSTDALWDDENGCPAEDSAPSIIAGGNAVVIDAAGAPVWSDNETPDNWDDDHWVWEAGDARVEINGVGTIEAGKNAFVATNGSISFSVHNSPDATVTAENGDCFHVDNTEVDVSGGNFTAENGAFISGKAIRINLAPWSNPITIDAKDGITAEVKDYFYIDPTETGTNLNFGKWDPTDCVDLETFNVNTDKEGNYYLTYK